MDIIEVEVVNKLFASVAEEMGIVLARSSFSPNIKERRDFSCAIFDRAGELVAQAAHIPVHLGAMPRTLDAVRARLTLAPGDIVIVNDPFAGGSHLPDITLVEGVFDRAGELMFYVVNRAHHADVGGRSPGSMGLSGSLADEGVLIPPTLLQAAGRPNEEFLDDFLAKVRNPRERQGDLRAQAASLGKGRQRLSELLARHGADHLFAILDQLKEYAERLMRAAIAGLPAGCYRFTDHLDDDGLAATPLPITVELHLEDSGATVDFTGSAPQVTTPLNTVEAVTVSAALYAFQCLLGDGYPINQGSYRPIRVIAPPGTIVNALPPAPVAAGNVETSQRLVDVLFGALAQAAPELIPAASCGSMNNVAIGAADGSFTYYETIGGGMGARPGREGLSGIHTHMTNTMNTPVEALEHAYPFQVARYRLRENSGGKGRDRGGDGIVRAYRFLEPAHVSLLTERRRLAPYGLQGGGPGRRGANELFRNGRRQRLKGKVNFEAEPGDVLMIRTPGGGGWGEPG